MEARIYKPKRLRNGKRTIGRLYRARVKLTGDNKVRDIPLKVSDKQVAQQKLNKLVQELEHESAGLIPAKPERETAQSPLLDLVSEYVNELTSLGAVGRSPAPCKNAIAPAGPGMSLDAAGGRDSRLISIVAQGADHQSAQNPE